MVIRGIATSQGMAVGKAVIRRKVSLDVSRRPVTSIVAELETFNNGLEATVEQLERIIKATTENVGAKEAGIFEAHRMMVLDEEFQDDVKTRIEHDGDNAVYAVDSARKDLMAIFAAMESDYMKERAADINDVCQRVIRNMLGIRENNSLPEQAVIFSEELEPSDTAMLDPSKISGIVTEKGGKTCHSAIIAQSLGIPALTGIRMEGLAVCDGDVVLIDGYAGEVNIGPTNNETYVFRQLMEEKRKDAAKYETTRAIGGCTRDGVHMEIAANIADPAKACVAVAEGADGVGLFRTEFLYMNRESLPSVDEQYKAYRTALEAFGDKPMVIRTFDIGGDKPVEYLNLPKEENPFLGYRAVRISLDRTEMFKDQLRALLMASPYGNLRIMVPMISCIEEVVGVKRLLKEVEEELKGKSVEIGSYQLGIMVEVPVVAIEADKFAKHVDFFSIGTNDLLQYTIAVDRMNDKLTKLYDWHHPGLLKLIRMVADAAKKAGIWVGICGEAAGDENLLPYFVGIGIDELSMSVGKVAKIKWHLSVLETETCKAIAEKVLELETAGEVQKYLESLK